MCIIRPLNNEALMAGQHKLIKYENWLVLQDSVNWFMLFCSIWMWNISLSDIVNESHIPCYCWPFITWAPKVSSRIKIYCLSVFKPSWFNGHKSLNTIILNTSDIEDILLIVFLILCQSFWWEMSFHKYLQISVNPPYNVGSFTSFWQHKHF